MFDPTREQERADHFILQSAYREVVAFGRELAAVQYETAMWERLFDRRLAESNATRVTVIPALTGANLTT